MSNSDQMRSILNLLESVSKPLEEVKQGKIGRAAMPGSRSGLDTIGNDPIPYADNSRGISNDSNWMKRAVFGDNFKDHMEPLYLDPANNRFQFIGGWSDKEKAFVYFPNNTAKTLGSVQARGIRALFAANGMKEGKDYVLDQQHELLKIFKKQNFLNS
jgi:hypothetical protein